MKRMKEAWDTKYGDKPMSAQTLRDNAARFRKGKSLLNLIEVRDGNDVEPEAIQIGVIEPARIKENVNENQSNEEENLENNNDKDDDKTKVMRLSFEDIL